jgi:2-oxoglutarate ferredoxin oxidoreductase subunit alpha
MAILDIPLPLNPKSSKLSWKLLLENNSMVVLQAESETASINMVYGGASCGKYVMTSSSSPGISLMQEGISYLAGAELP